MKTVFPVTDLTSAQQVAWLHQNPAPLTSREALGRLQETTRLCLENFDNDQLLATQTLLEDALIQTLIAMRSLNLNPDQALQRALYRAQSGTEHRAFHIFSDRVEVQVHGEIRGEWPLYTQSDYEVALKLARELGCDVIHEDACQLGLFNHVGRLAHLADPA